MAKHHWFEGIFFILCGNLTVRGFYLGYARIFLELGMMDEHAGIEETSLKTMKGISDV